MRKPLSRALTTPLNEKVPPSLAGIAGGVVVQPITAMAVAMTNVLIVARMACLLFPAKRMAALRGHSMFPQQM